MMPLSPAERNKLIGILGMLGSEFRDEVATAGSMATNLVRKHGLTWDDVLPPASTPKQEPPRQYRPTCETGVRADIRLCSRHLAVLTDWERNFVTSVSGRSKLSDKQTGILRQAADKLRSRGLT